MLTIRERSILIDERALLRLADTHVEVWDADASSFFLRFRAHEPTAYLSFLVGSFCGVERLVACHRKTAYWMEVFTGTDPGETPVETQYLLLKCAEDYCLVVPLLDGDFRASLQGDGAHGLAVVIESGALDVKTTSATALFVAVGRNPYELMNASAQRVMRQMGMVRLREEKPLPAFVDHFGWCTWNAFYRDVSQEKVLEGLRSFAANRVQPRFVILDDGWQSTRDSFLTSFEANSRFGADLSRTTRAARETYGIETFLVWHAVNGYWAGVDGACFPDYQVQIISRRTSPGLQHYLPDGLSWEAHQVGVVVPDDAGRFFDDYYAYLRAQGVDGVKVDNQASLDALSASFGGRVRLIRAYRHAFEGAAQKHFGGNLINCMSCSNDALYGVNQTVLARTSDDFIPDHPQMHSAHLVANAQVGMWFGEFIQPDWDMFQSAHPTGGFHAAGRAVSGGPVYVSDPPQAHDFDLLRKLVLPDGQILRARLPGRPTEDCLFDGPGAPDRLLKLFNLNVGAGIIGVFNTHTDGPSIAGAVAPRDVDGLAGNRFAVLRHSTRQCADREREEQWQLSLPPLGYDLFTIVPIDDGVAPLGLIEMFNSAGAIRSKGWCSTSEYDVTVVAEGLYWLYSEWPCLAIHTAEGGRAIPFSYDAMQRILEFRLEADCVQPLVIHFQREDNRTPGLQ